MKEVSKKVLLDWWFFDYRLATGGILLSSPKEEPRKAPPFRTGGRRLGGLTPKTPAIDRRQAIPPPSAPGLTLQAG